jgi:U3 small nucleolar RNA-associated protein 12
MVALTGLYKLRGHKDVVTGVKILTRGTQKLIVSISKDTLLKVWDLATQYCVQTVVGHRTEIWSLAVSQREGDYLVATGSSDGMLRGFSLTSEAEVDSKNALGDEEVVLQELGAIGRQFGTDKCLGLAFNAEGTVLAAQSSGKYVELFSVRDAQQAKKKMKRRLKRQREKTNRGDAAEDGAVQSIWSDEHGAEEDATNRNEERLILSDLLDKLEVVKCPQRVRSCAFR